MSRAILSGDRSQHTNWCFTFNYGGVSADGGEQPPREAVDRFVEYLLGKRKYLVAGFEAAPTTGQLHLQGYVQLAKRARLSELKRFPDGGTVHWEPAIADELKNRDYCLGFSHNKTPAIEYIEDGEAVPVNPGLREKKRWAEALDNAKRGKLADVDPQIQICQFGNLCKIAARYGPRPVDLLPGWKAQWYYGPTGSGKSRLARSTLTSGYPDGFYIKTHNKYWDHYEHGQGVLIDDLGLEIGKMLRDHLKQWADFYVFCAEYKGGTFQIRPPELFITSNFHPWEIWGGSKDYEPLMRRFNIVWFGPEGEEPQYDGSLINLPPISPVQLPRDFSTLPTVQVNTPVPVPDLPVSAHQEIVDLTNDDEGDVV